MEEKATLTFIARIKDKKGNIIEREVETIIPDPENMDYSSMDTFGSVTNFVGFRVPNVSLSTSIEDL